MVINSVPYLQKIVSASRDNTVRVWSSASGNCEQMIDGHTNGVMSVTFSPEGRQIVSESLDNTVRVWDVATGECEQTMIHIGPVFSAQCSPDGRLIVSGGTDNTVLVWDAATAGSEHLYMCHTLETDASLTSSFVQL